MPAVSVYDIELSIQRDLGGKFGDVVYFSKPMDSRHGFLTANDVTPYVVSAQSTKEGPIVVEPRPMTLTNYLRRHWTRVGNNLKNYGRIVMPC